MRLQRSHSPLPQVISLIYKNIDSYNLDGKKFTLQCFFSSSLAGSLSDALRLATWLQWIDTVYISSKMNSPKKKKINTKSKKLRKDVMGSHQRKMNRLRRKKLQGYSIKKKEKPVRFDKNMLGWRKIWNKNAYRIYGRV